jgi:hypothetical protein
MANQTNNNNNQNPPRFGTPNPPAQAPAPAPSRFGSGSRFGGAPATPAQPAAPASGPAPASRFGGGTASRFGSGRFGGREEVQWTVVPLRLEAVRISLEGLGDPLHRLLGTPINAVFSKPAKLIEALGKDEDLLKRLSDVLNEAWDKYEFRGAALLYPWDENIRKAYNQVPQPTPPPVEKKEADTEDDDLSDELPDWLAAPSQKTSVCLRAIDASFVLNILARSRANVVVANTPLALEPGFLDQSLLCDDPRIITLARATGCIEENW